MPPVHGLRDALGATELGQDGPADRSLHRRRDPGDAAFIGVIIEALSSLTGVARVLLASMVGISVVLLVTGV